MRCLSIYLDLSFLSVTLFSLTHLGLYFLCYCEWKYFVNFIFVFFVVYSNTIDFYIFILHPENLVLASLKKNCLGFSTFGIISFADHFPSSFPIWIPLFSCTNCTFNSLVCGSGESRHPCLISAVN